MSRYATTPIPEVAIEVQGQVPADAVGYARSRVSALAGYTHEPILFARAKLTQSADPAVTRRATVQANLDLNGRLVRAQVQAPTMHEAIDLLHDRLRHRLERMARHWEARRGAMGSADEHEWRHGDEPARRPNYYPRPPEERQIVRHKAFTLAIETPDEAADEMDAMDYDFHLFRDAGTGLDAVIYRSGPSGYRLARTARSPEGAVGTATLSPQPVPRLHVSEAVHRLDVTGWPFVFFVDATTGRGSVLYHRYDGHYGLIAPAA